MAFFPRVCGFPKTLCISTSQWAQHNDHKLSCGYELMIWFPQLNNIILMFFCHGHTLRSHSQALNCGHSLFLLSRVVMSGALCTYSYCSSHVCSSFSLPYPALLSAFVKVYMSVIVSNVTLVDNGMGIMPLIYEPPSVSHEYSNKTVLIKVRSWTYFMDIFNIMLKWISNVYHCNCRCIS